MAIVDNQRLSKSVTNDSELGMISGDWRVVAVGDIADVRTGPFGSVLHERDYVPFGTPIVTVEHLSERGLIHENLPMVSDSDRRRLSAYSLKANDIVFSRVGSVDRNSIVNSKEEGWLFSGRLLRVRIADDGIDPLFISYCFHQESFKQRVRTVAVGQTMASINTQILRSIKLALPNKKQEQTRVASALSDVDALISGLEKLIAKKRAIKQGAMQELLTGKRRLPGYKAQWTTSAFGDLFAFSGGYMASRDQLSTRGHCYLHYGDIHLSQGPSVNVKQDFGSIPKLDIPLMTVPKRFLLEDGDVVFVDASEDIEGTSRHIVVVNPDRIPFISGLHTIIAKARTNDLSHEYLRYCFQTKAVKDQFCYYAVGTKVSGVSRSNIAKIFIKYPSKPEQQAIATVLTDMEEEIYALGHKLDKLQCLKQGMMQSLLTGKIRLTA